MGVEDGQPVAIYLKREGPGATGRRVVADIKPTVVLTTPHVPGVAEVIVLRHILLRHREVGVALAARSQADPVFPIGVEDALDLPPGRRYRDLRFGAGLYHR